jgi:hypothetical protein
VYSSASFFWEFDMGLRFLEVVTELAGYAGRLAKFSVISVDSSDLRIAEWAGKRSFAYLLS